jgi:hypothetical protein
MVCVATNIQLVFFIYIHQPSVEGYWPVAISRHLFHLMTCGSSRHALAIFPRSCWFVTGQGTILVSTSVSLASIVNLRHRITL